jgi:predicted nicotinamide N-methyase
VYITEQPSLLAARGTTGLRTWEASLFLSEWVLTQDVKGKKILELGAGTGLAGILAAKRGACVTATDGSHEVVASLQKNYELNSVQAETEILWWGEASGLLKERWDYILGADITYDEDVCSSLAETFAAGLRRGGTGFVAATVRNEATVDAFVRECGTFCWDILIAEARNLHVGNVQGWDRSKVVFFSYDRSPMRLLELSMRPQ